MQERRETVPKGWVEVEQVGSLALTRRPGRVDDQGIDDATTRSGPYRVPILHGRVLGAGPPDGTRRANLLARAW